MHTPATPDEAEIDAAIGACLRDWASPASLQSLTDLGPTALTRWIEVFHGQGNPFARPRNLKLPGSAEAEIWWVMMGALAQAYPGQFLDAFEAGQLNLDRDDTALLVTLGSIDDPRAVMILIDALSSPDWLSRWHAVEGLAGRSDEGVRPALQRATEDSEQVVREAAQKALRRRRPRFRR